MVHFTHVQGEMEVITEGGTGKGEAASSTKVRVGDAHQLSLCTSVLYA